MRRRAALAVVLAAWACAGTPPAPSRAEQQAIALNARAARAFEQGDYRRARSLYEEALRIDASVENADGIAANALSLARVHQAAGDSAAAHAVLDALLARSSAGGPLAIAPLRRADALARKAQLYLAAGDLARAAESADRAVALCASCAALPAILNLRGRVALAAREPAAALDWAAKALAAATAERGATSDGRAQRADLYDARVERGEIYDARIERANALRLTGEARLARGEAAAALAPLEQALELDRELRRSGRIRLDLMALGRSHAALGNAGAAKEFYSRALAVGAAASDDAGAQEARRALAGP